MHILYFLWSQHFRFRELAAEGLNVWLWSQRFGLNGSRNDILIEWHDLILLSLNKATENQPSILKVTFYNYSFMCLANASLQDNSLQNVKFSQ